MFKALTQLMLIPLVLIISVIYLFFYVMKAIGIKGMIMIMKVLVALVWLPMKIFLMAFGITCYKSCRGRRWVRL